jgi:hypothetical protein
MSKSVTQTTFAFQVSARAALHHEPESDRTLHVGLSCDETSSPIYLLCTLDKITPMASTLTSSGGVNIPDFQCFSSYIKNISAPGEPLAFLFIPHIRNPFTAVSPSTSYSQEIIPKDTEACLIGSLKRY